MKKFSILGLVLVGASAITAAFIPSKTTVAGTKVAPDDGHLTLTTGGGPEQTCRFADGDEIDCTYTATGIGANLSTTSRFVGDHSISTPPAHHLDTGTVTTI